MAWDIGKRRAARDLTGGLLRRVVLCALLIGSLSGVLIGIACEQQGMAFTMIEYRKAGGVAGIEQLLRIEGDGTLHFHRSISGTPEYDIKGRLDAKQVQEVMALADRANLFSLQDEYKAASQIFDAFSYQVTYKRTDREKTVKVESMGSVPESFQLLLNRLDTIIQDLFPTTVK